MKLWPMWNVLVFLLNTWCCAASHKSNMQNLSEFHELSVMWQAPVTRACPTKRVRIHLFRQQKSSGGPAQACGLNFFRAISILIIFSKTAFCNFFPLENIKTWQRCDKKEFHHWILYWKYRHKEESCGFDHQFLTSQWIFNQCSR